MFHASSHSTELKQTSEPGKRGWGGGGHFSSSTACCPHTGKSILFIGNSTSLSLGFPSLLCLVDLKNRIFPSLSAIYSTPTIGNDGLFPIFTPGEKWFLFYTSHPHSAYVKKKCWGEWVSRPAKQIPSAVFSGRWRSETRQCGSCLSGVLTLTFCRNPGRERVFKDLQLLGNFSKTQVIIKTHQERDNRMAGGGGEIMIGSLNRREKKA